MLCFFLSFQFSFVGFFLRRGFLWDHTATACANGTWCECIAWETLRLPIGATIILHCSGSVCVLLAHPAAQNAFVWRSVSPAALCGLYPDVWKRAEQARARTVPRGAPCASLGTGAQRQRCGKRAAQRGTERNGSARRRRFSDERERGGRQRLLLITAHGAVAAASGRPRAGAEVPSGFPDGSRTLCGSRCPDTVRRRRFAPTHRHWTPRVRRPARDSGALSIPARAGRGHVTVGRSGAERGKSPRWDGAGTGRRRDCYFEAGCGGRLWRRGAGAGRPGTRRPRPLRAMMAIGDGEWPTRGRARGPAARGGRASAPLPFLRPIERAEPRVRRLDVSARCWGSAAGGSGRAARGPPREREASGRATRRGEAALWAPTGKRLAAVRLGWRYGLRSRVSFLTQTGESRSVKRCGPRGHVLDKNRIRVLPPCPTLSRCDSFPYVRLRFQRKLRSCHLA